MDLINVLGLKNISFEVLYNEGKQFRNKWEERFTYNFSNKEKKKIYLTQNLWHIFSYKKVEHLDKEEAVQAFHNIRKNECYIFY